MEAACSSETLVYKTVRRNNPEDYYLVFVFFLNSENYFPVMISLEYFYLLGGD
jgi:hypothetical protein